MAFASGSVSFRRFAISGSPLGEDHDKLAATLAEFAFGRRGAADPTLQVGWINPTHLFDHEINPAKIGFGRFAHIAMRIDRLSVPAAVARSYQRLEEEAALAASGRAFLSRSEQRAAKETAKIRIEQEMKSGAFRRMSSVPILIDLLTNTLLLGGGGANAGDRLIELFGNTFNRPLIPIDADQLAERLLGTNARVLEQIRPFHLVEEPNEAPDGELPQISTSFLGREFLSWIWYLTDATASPGLKLRNGDEITVAIDRSIRLQCDFGMTGVAALTADAPAGLPEARAAVAIGKQPTRSGLVIGSPVGEFALTLDGPKMAVSGMVVPEEEASDNRGPRELLEERFERCFDSVGLLDVIFETFLRVRVGANWGATLSDMQKWARAAAGSANRSAARAAIA